MKKEKKFLSVALFVFVIITSNAFSQNKPNYGIDSVQCVINVSLYKEYFKQDNYKDAIDPWRKVMILCPQYSKNIYLNGVTMYTDLLDKEVDKDKKEDYIDTIMFLHAQRIQFYNQDGLVSGKMGLTLFDNRPEKLDKINEFLDKSVNLEGDASNPTVLFRYFQVKTKLYFRDENSDKPDRITKLNILEAYDKAATIAEKKIKAGGKYAKNFQISKNNIETLADPFFSCGDIKEIYFEKIESNPDDLDLLKKIISLLTKRNCLTDDFYLDVAERLHKKEPNAESAASLARMYVKKGDYLIAMDYFNNAVKLQTDNVELAQYYLEMAEVEYRQFKNYSKARTLALKAASARPNWGKPFILIGDLYASSSKMCGDGSSIESKSVFWAAEDKYRKAKTVDPSVAEIANQKIGTYKKYYPKKEDLFFEGKEAGQAYTVGCWIGESTTVRTVD